LSPLQWSKRTRPAVVRGRRAPGWAAADRLRIFFPGDPSIWYDRWRTRGVKDTGAAEIIFAGRRPGRKTLPV